MSWRPPIQILDGGLGTSLEDEYGVQFDGSTMPLWSSHFLVADPELLLACQSDFGRAGVDILLTPTYQVSVAGFARTKTAEHPDGIHETAIGPFLSRAVDIAEKAKLREAAELALSLGPYGATMVPGQEYSGKYDDVHDSEEALFTWHLERLQLFTREELCIERVQFVAFETVPRLDEIRAVRRAAHAAGLSSKKVWISCVFPGDQDALPDGSSVEQVVEAMLCPREDQVTPWGIGINCTKIARLPRLVEKYEAAVAYELSKSAPPTAPALVLYPDGTRGEVYNTATQKWEISPEAASRSQEPASWESQLASVVKKAQERAGFASFLVGGCCKANHRNIAELRRQLKD
ncbi:Homocysteine S-methyltransferase [Thozetella sp. PMI_491]|nr:Homocysteine S-methyltransferase [Thozetella sp. PMI_491]